jgi:hypothetical protein
MLRTNSAAIPLFGQIIPLIGRQNSAVRQRSEIRVRRKSNQALARSASAFRQPKQAFFTVFAYEKTNRRLLSRSVEPLDGTSRSGSFRGNDDVER